MLKLFSSMLCASRIHPFSLGNYLRTSLIIGNLIMIIRVTSVEWTWLGLNWRWIYLKLGFCSSTINSKAKIERWLWFWIMHLHMLLVLPKLVSLMVFQPWNWEYGIPPPKCYKRSATFGSRYNSIFQNSLQEENFAVGFVTIWWCYIEWLKEGGAQHQISYHVELWSMEWVGCTNSHELLEDGAYITNNMECWFYPSWWKGEE
jgi:hypothetical protein